ncbi:hypothetical protein [Methylobacterium sp. J-090]|uniref:hypothetical protein n=1 Tax=Methylobacterium sp. J-090 TaxID=2836666 RepID=UPI001FB8BAA9|nr:hypothetical protein [Methylobacterium sp. J-090]MCJ2082830.1 hypothetical protein [Methylobacterium sp. J-090]
MNVEPIGAVTILLGLIALFRGPDFAVGVFIPLTLLGAAAAILLGGSGTIQPAHLMLGFVAIAIFADATRLGPVTRCLTFPREGFWFSALAAYGVAGAFLLPRLFVGATFVNAIGATEHGPSVVLVPLGPTSGNLTQSIYLLADLVCFLAILAYAARPRGFARVVGALLVYAAANIVFAIIDLVTGLTGTGFLLEFIRNADYQLHVEETTGGLRRIVGSFTETSAFSYATVGSLGFTAQLWLLGYRPWLTGGLSFMSLALLAFSTSTTAYVATPVLLVVLYTGAIARVARGRASATTFVFLAIGPLMTLLICLAILLTPSASSALSDFLSVAIFDKSASQSGTERAQWNQTALQNFFDTFGAGGGLGSIRASSFIMAVPSNLGIIGIFCFIMIFVQIFFSKRESIQGSMHTDARGAARMACVGILIAAAVSGALVDLGLPFYVFAGLACAEGERQKLACEAIQAQPAT